MVKRSFALLATSGWALLPVFGLMLALAGRAPVARAGSRVESLALAGHARPRAACAVRLNDTPYPTVQAALAAAQDGDTVKVSGTCHEHDLLVTRTLTLEGGWNSLFTVRDPVLYLTTIDAQMAGRVLAIDGQGRIIAPTLRDLTLINGRAASAPVGPGLGGGLYAVDAEPLIVGNVVSNCVAYMGTQSGLGRGGGAYVASAGAGTLVSGNLFVNDTALAAPGEGTSGAGGGLYFSGVGTVQANTFRDNTGAADSYNPGWGGRLYLSGGPVKVLSNTVQGNLASWNSSGYGGGVALSGVAAGSLIAGNVISANESSWGMGLWVYGIGGGVYQQHGGLVTWQDNQVVNNWGNEECGGGGGWGGGFHLASTEALFTGTHVIQGNCPGPWADKGGGLYVVGESSVVTISGAAILSNTAAGSTSNPALGGGIYLGAGRLTLQDSTVQGNSVAGSGVANKGGGLYAEGGTLRVERSLIQGNTAPQWGNGVGGGLALEGNVDAVLNANRILGNSASKQSGTGHGGGVYVDSSGAVAMTNDVIAANYARTGGSALYALSQVRMLHNTVAENTGPSGLVAGAGGTLALTNTLVASHTLGITATGGTVLPMRTLFWQDGPGGVRGTDPLDGAPAFVDPAVGDYHIRFESEARDQGVDAGVADDLDGQARGGLPDIGADEWVSEGLHEHLYLPLVLR